MDLYLKFPSKEVADLVLYTDEDPNYRNIDVIGLIYEGDEWDEDGNELIAPTPIDGWHVNVRLVDDEDGTPLEPYSVTPATPRRVWA